MKDDKNDLIEHADQELLKQKRLAFNEESINFYELTRTGTQFSGMYDLFKSSGPFIPYVLRFIDSESLHEHLALIYGDKKGSRIDVKTQNPTKIIRGGDHQLDHINNTQNTLEGTKTFKHITDIKKDLLETLNNLFTLEEAIMFQTEVRERIIRFNPTYNKHERFFLRMLYHVMGNERVLYWEKKKLSASNEFLSLNQRGRELITYIFSEIYTGMEDAHMLRGSEVFQDYLLNTTIKRIMQKEIMTVNDYVEIMTYLTSKTPIELIRSIPEYKDLDEIQLKSHANKIDANKKVFLNICYAGMYVIEKYNLKFISEHIGKYVKEYSSILDTQCGEKLAEISVYETNTSLKDKPYCINTFRAGGTKSLFKTAVKVLNKRDDIIKDLIGVRTTINYEYFLTQGERARALAACCEVIIKNFINIVGNSGFEVTIKAVTLKNRYTAFSTKKEFQQTGIIDQIKDHVEKSLIEQGFPSVKVECSDLIGQIMKQKDKSGGIQSKNIELIESGIGEKKDIELIINNSKGLKTGMLGGKYEDFQLIIHYELTVPKNISHIYGEKITSTGGYEHQIVFSDHNNESGLANHTFSFDPLKLTKTEGRSISTIGFDKVWKFVSQGIDNHILKMQSMIEQLNNTEYAKRAYTHQIPRQNMITLPMSKRTIEFNLLGKNRILLQEVKRELCCYVIDHFLESGQLFLFEYKNDIESRGEILDPSVIIEKRKKLTSSDIYELKNNDRHKIRFCFDLSALMELSSLPSSGYVTICGKSNTAIRISVPNLSRILGNQRVYSSVDIKSQGARWISDAFDDKELQ